MACLVIKHHCTRVEMTLEQEEGELELEVVGDDILVVNQARHLCIFFPLFWINEVYVSCLCMSYYMYH